MNSVRFFCPRWGSEHVPWPVFLEKVRSAGFDGIEWAIPGGTPAAELDQVWNLTEKANIPVIVQHYDTVLADFNQHMDAYMGWLTRMGPYPALLINSQTGRDHFTFEQNRALINMSYVQAEKYGRPLVHETHRGKFSFAAHVTKPYLEALSHLRLTLDVSHWVCVAESYLTDQQEALQLAWERTSHVHARVGYTEGPQVPDPWQGRWEQALKFHLSCWDEVVDRRKHCGGLTITTEFGPFPYSTRNSPARQWAMNQWMLQILQKRYCQ